MFSLFPDSIDTNFRHLLFSHKFLKLCSFFSNLFSLCCSEWVIFILLFSSPLTLSSVLSILLFITSMEVFNSDITFSVRNFNIYFISISMLKTFIYHFIVRTLKISTYFKIFVQIYLVVNNNNSYLKYQITPTFEEPQRLHLLTSFFH